MREIIFRGFYPDKDGKEKVFVNGEWVKGFWVHGYYVLFDRKEHRIYTGEYFGEYTTDYYIVIPETVGQYTELKGKNGKKIFEGDICKESIETYVKKWENKGIIEKSYGAFGLASFDKKHFLAFINASIYVRHYEVIGNIYDNPELLEDEE